MTDISVSRLAYILAFLGGILLVIFGILSFIGYSIETLRSLLEWRFFAYGFAYRAIVGIICGVIAIIGSKSANTLVWAIALVIVGIIGQGLGGLLVVLGGLLGLVAAVTKRAGKS